LVRHSGWNIMQRTLLKSKIHRARVTDANLNYEGSLTMDPLLMEKADILPYEKVEIANISNGERFSTYVIKGKPNSGEMCLNGAAARLGSKGDLIIIMTYVILPEEKVFNHHPRLILVDEHNRIKSVQN
jgi:aspartate 1-decarboxylase